jgi:transcription initiation factor TFIIB
MSKEIAAQPNCPECGGIQRVRDMKMGEIVCCGCGLVIREGYVSSGPEYTAFTPEEIKSRVRVGSPTSYHRFDKGLSTVIRVERDAFGRRLSPKVRNQMWRPRRWQIRSRVHSSVDRNLSQVMMELDRLSDKLHIPSSVQEMAAVIYRKALDKGLVRGRSIAGIMAGALYAACRFAKTPRTLKEITDASIRDPKEVSRSYRLIVRHLKMGMPIDDPLEYVTKIAEKSGVSSEVEGLAIKIIRDAKNKHATSGKDPIGLAATALYIAAKLKKEKINQSQFAKAANITEVTIRNRKKALMRDLSLKFN